VSCSYGPGRYDPHYEEQGQDYPVGFVRCSATVPASGGVPPSERWNANSSRAFARRMAATAARAARGRLDDERGVIWERSITSYRKDDNPIFTEMSANESATIGDIRTVISAQAAYQSANGGWYASTMTCLSVPTGGTCIPSYPTNGPTFLDPNLAAQAPKSGYNRSFDATAITGVNTAVSGSDSTGAYAYSAWPVTVGQSGVRAFAGDSSGVICFTPNASTASGSPRLPQLLNIIGGTNVRWSSCRSFANGHASSPEPSTMPTLPFCR